ncbi:hypothetical protein G4B88_016059 [Cannabis sativa]|uniref:DUF1985 domain-containing protein n=1 Tax=Cannabis sativa TaxID=3483 RepID=A0A7J6ET98_CANSA|nr:hypothetical protein G4B88_016059 [Cannabis sativa]
MKTRIDDDDDDVVKLTKVFIMHNILQNKRGQCHVDNFVMKLVDDEQMFENYPWGHRSFNDTVNSLSTILNRQKIGYEICGFPLAFQVWGFEILPSLGSSFVIKNLMKESDSLKELNAEIREENVKIKKENAEIREKITEITNENCGLKDEIAAVRKQVDVFMQYFTNLLELKTSFKNIEKLVLWLAENGGAKQRTCGEKENAKESGEDLVILNERQQDNEANEGSRSMDHVNDKDYKDVVEANKCGKTIIESDDDIPTFNLLSQLFSKNENESLCETLKVLRSKRNGKTTLSRYLISLFEPLNKLKDTRQRDH